MHYLLEQLAEEFKIRYRSSRTETNVYHNNDLLSFFIVKRRIFLLNE